MSFKIRAVWALLVGLGVILVLAMLPVDETSRGKADADRLYDALSQAAAASGSIGRYLCKQEAHGRDLLPMASAFAARGPLGAGDPLHSDCTLLLSRDGWRLTAELQGPEIKPVTASTVRIHWTSLLPALLAVTLAMATRRLIVSLLAGVALGAALASGDPSLWGVVKGASAGGIGRLAMVMVDDFRLYIFLFTFSLIGIVNVAVASGGMQGLADALGRLARSARSTQAATVLLGLAVFFDDYSNTVVVGGSMRPLADRARISREKLAYLVDSTTAPVAGLALISTWIGYEVSLIGDAMRELKMTESAYALFIQALPFRFYCILALVFVWLTIIMRREFGPMYTAQIRAATTGQLLRPGAQPLSGAKRPEILGRPLALNALLPVLTVIGAVLVGMAANGAGLLGPWYVNTAAWTTFDWGRLVQLEGNYLIACQDGAWVLAMASLLGTGVALIGGVAAGRAPFGRLVLAWLSSWRVLLLAFSVLILAWAIGDLNGELGTGAYLVAALGSTLSPFWVPVLIFLLGAAISFATGSSWGAMAVLLPAAVPLAYHVGGLPS